ncbi:MAG TPA: hypothetical protein VFD11_11630 [Thiopseudomonas sp.]|nr:hypothetical protein [Thiopseudomonas sp.]
MSQTLISPAKVTLALLAGIAVSLIAAITLWFSIGVEPVRNPSLNIEDLPSTQMHSVSDFNAVLARPLFWQEREPIAKPEEDVVVEATVTSPLRRVRLLGIILTGDVRKVLLEVEGAMTSVQVGDTVQDWTVESITTKEITFVAGTERTALSLERKRPDSIQLEPML